MRTLVIGASTDTSRYSNMAVRRLKSCGHEVFAIGKKAEKIEDINIMTNYPEIENLHTITLYLNAKNQEKYYQYILNFNPKRIIFNPGAENPELKEMAEKKGIETIEACTLVMLSCGLY
jgi:predicted CoA-binding protein